MQTYKNLIELIEAQSKFGIDLFDTDNRRVNYDAVWEDNNDMPHLTDTGHSYRNHVIEVMHSYTGEYHSTANALSTVIELHGSQGGCRK